jgi:excinuclease ABC subunit C
MAEQNLPFDHRAFLKTLTSRAGVYRMLGMRGEVLYLGKARNLKKRVSSYFRSSGLPAKTRAFMDQVRGVEVTVTSNEAEALILENNLIKELMPRYNILLRDDKSYPYIYLSGDDFPRLAFHRGARSAPGRYFGPYPSAGAVRETLSLLQKVFPIRQCEDSFFRNRTRPCLQYQIKRCSAPCVGLIDKDGYAQDVRHAVWFLEGKEQQVMNELVSRMDAAAHVLEYEHAARYRDQIASLRRIQAKQYVTAERGDVDVIAGTTRGGAACVQVFYIRGGRNLGNKSFFPQHAGNADATELLAAFVPQYYLGRETPHEILVNHRLKDTALLEQALTQQTGHRVVLRHPVRGERARWLAMATTNAEHALEQFLFSRASAHERLILLQDALGLDTLPERLECFDISHTRGEAAVAACVVFDVGGPLKSDYRRFNVQGITPGDDYAALRQALGRRYTRLKEGEGKLPDVLLIDGGKGQLTQAVKVLEELQVDGVTVVSIAKGPERKPGKETLFVAGNDQPLTLAADQPALHLVQQIRDEAHRFAITGHRLRRAKARHRSPLEGISGLGPKRRQGLLRQLGGLQEIARAGVEDLARVPGISKDMAERIYDTFHEH